MGFVQRVVKMSSESDLQPRVIFPLGTCAASRAGHTGQLSPLRGRRERRREMREDIGGSSGRVDITSRKRREKGDHAAMGVWSLLLASPVVMPRPAEIFRRCFVLPSRTSETVRDWVVMGDPLTVRPVSRRMGCVGRGGGRTGTRL